MKTRHVYSTNNLDEARAAMNAAREAGVGEDCILVVARSDIELDSISNEHKEADSDFMQGAIKGVAAGGATGALLGLAAIVLTPIGITLAGIGAAAVGGAALGGLFSSIFGSALPDPVRQKFDDEISAGKILIIIDTDAELQQTAGPAIERSGAVALPFEQTTATIR